MKKKIIINRNKQNAQRLFLGMSAEAKAQVSNRAMRRAEGKKK